MKQLEMVAVALAFAAPLALGASPAFAAKQPHMRAAMRHLKQAQAEFQKASPNKAGHRVKALDLAKQAEAEVQQGIEAGNQPKKK